MKKYREVGIVVTLLLICIMCASCALEGYGNIQSAQDANAVMGENIIIDGVDVSGMRIDDALSALNERHNAQKANMNFNIKLEDESVTVSGTDLPIKFNSEEVILEALKLKEHYPQNNEARVFSCEYGIDETEAASALAELVNELNIEAQNASAKYDRNADGGFVYTEHKVGRSVNVEDMAAKVSEGVYNGSYDVEAVADEVQPEHTLENVKADNTLISEFSTSFAGKTYSKPNRVFNIRKAASMIDGQTIDPGEEFDMNAVLGNRNEKNGWKKAAGIRDAKYVQEYGGGVCQVSTTLYNAVLMADLKVTDRSHHSWPLGYIDVGRDATISTGGPNFRFVNNSKVPVTISAEADQKTRIITVRIYGRPNEDYASITLSSRQTGSIADPGDEVVMDRGLKSGTRNVERESRGGVIAETYKEYRDKDGKVIKRERVTTDKYRPVKGLVYVAEDVYHNASAASTVPVAITDGGSAAGDDLTGYFEGLQE